jgi:hypothetical protein
MEPGEPARCFALGAPGSVTALEGRSGILSDAFIEIVGPPGYPCPVTLAQIQGVAPVSGESRRPLAYEFGGSR